MENHAVPATFDARDIVPVSYNYHKLCPHHRHKAKPPTLPSSITDINSFKQRGLQFGWIAAQLRGPSINPDLLNPAFDALDMCLIPDSTWKTLYAKRSIELAYLSIVLVVGYIVMNCRTRALAQRILDTWPALWAWIRFLLVNVVESDGESLRPTTAMLECLGHTTYALGHNPFFHHVIHELGHTPGFVETVTREWLEEAERGHRRPKGDRLKLYDVLTRGFFTLLWIGFLKKDTPYKEILDAANGPTSLALSALRHVQTNLDQKRGFTDALGQDLAIVHYIGSDDAPMHEEVLAAGFARQAVQCLFILDESALGNPYAPLCAGICYLFLVGAFKRRTDGHLYARQALRAGLLSAIPGNLKLLHQGKNVQLLYDLLENIHLHLLDFSTVRFVQIETILNHSWPDVGFPGLKDVLEIYYARFIVRFTTRFTADRMARLCGFCKVLLGRGQKVLKECRGCQSVRYCSRTCQKLHWPAHCTACKHVRGVVAEANNNGTRGNGVRELAGDKQEPPLRHKLFALVNANLEITVRRDELDAALDQFRHVSRKALVACLDCAQMPAPLIVRLDHNADKHHSPNDGAVHRGFDDLMVEVTFLWEGRKRRVRGVYASLSLKEGF